MNFSGVAFSYVCFSVLHFLLFLLAITVCGLYGVDLNHADEQDKYADGKWVYAEVVGGLAAVTAAIYLFPVVLRFAFIWVWSFVLFIFWITLFGIFGKMYIHEDAEGDGGIQRMKNAVWVDLVNALLWLINSIATFTYWWGHRERNSRFTGRAKV